MRNLIKIFNNFRKAAIAEALIQVYAIITSLLFLVAYTFAGEKTQKIIYPAFYFQKGNMAPQFMGMIFFLSCVFAIILGVFVIYQLLPAIFNKTKVQPKRIFIILGIINAVFFAVLLILTVILLVTETPKTLILFIVDALLAAIMIAVSAISIVPAKHCEFFMPEIKRN